MATKIPRIDIEDIRQRYQQNSNWERETTEELKKEIVKMLGHKEWHFEPVSFSNDRTYKMAGARVVLGKVQFCSARYGTWRCRKVGDKEERVATWVWIDFRFQHISWWIKMYEILMAAKDNAEVCKQIAGDECVAKTYGVPFIGQSCASI